MEVIPDQSDLLIIGPMDECDGDIAAFDLDHTLIKPANDGSIHYDVGGANISWLWNDFTANGRIVSIKECLQSLHAGGTNIVIFTNQCGLMSRGVTRSISIFRDRIHEMSQQLGFELTVLAALNRDRWRKPSPCMWWHFRNTCVWREDIEPIFVGDAAGRVSDFSDSDIKFAFNCNLKFATPEEYFGWVSMINKPPIPFPVVDGTQLQGFDFTAWVRDHTNPVVFVANPHRELVIIVGRPACGKSTLVRTFFGNYTHISQDTINKGKKGTRDQCIRAAKRALLEGSVIIDNTNPSREVRAQYIRAAQYLNIPVRCVHIDFDVSVCWHLNMCRTVLYATEIIPAVAYASYAKNFQQPELDEGFQEIITVSGMNMIDENNEFYRAVRGMRFASIRD